MGLRAPGRQRAGVVAAAPRGVGFGAGWTGQARLAPQEGESPRRCWLRASGPSWALPAWEGLPPAGTQSLFRTHRFRPVGASAWDPLWQGPGPRGGGGPPGLPIPSLGHRLLPREDRVRASLWAVLQRDQQGQGVGPGVCRPLKLVPVRRLMQQGHGLPLGPARHGPGCA